MPGGQGKGRGKGRPRKYLDDYRCKNKDIEQSLKDQGVWACINDGCVASFKEYIPEYDHCTGKRISFFIS